MLPAHHRLRRQADIARVFKAGKKLRSPHTVIYYLARPASPYSRAACIVSRKVHRSAVMRHRYQRWLRHTAKNLIKNSPLIMDIIIIALPSLARINEYKVIDKEITQTRKRIF
jgi:ribonuclease P protein component